MKKVVPKNAVLIPEQAKKVFEGQIFDVYQWPQKMFDGTTETFEMLRRPDTIAVLAIADDKILILEDTQPHTGSRLSLPTGRVDKTDPDTLSAAKREVLEETGYEFKTWCLVNVAQPHSKIEWFIYFYLALNGQKIKEPDLDAGEKIKVELMRFDEVKELALNKAGYLGEAQAILDTAGSIDGFEQLPEFEGHLVDR